MQDLLVMTHECRDDFHQSPKASRTKLNVSKKLAASAQYRGFCPLQYYMNAVYDGELGRIYPFDARIKINRKIATVIQIKRLGAR
jgi:hypothetical protein